MKPLATWTQITSKENFQRKIVSKYPPEDPPTANLGNFSNLCFCINSFNEYFINVTSSFSSGGQVVSQHLI